MDYLTPGSAFLVANAQEVVKNLTWESDIIDLTKLHINLLALQFELEDVAGNGVANIEVLLSIDGVNFINTLADVVTGLTKAAGNDVAKIAMDDIPANFIKILVTETGTVENVTLTIHAAGR